MRVFAYILVASIAAALLQRLMVALLIVLAIVMLWGLFSYPKEVLGLLCLGLISNLLRWNPWAGVTMLAILWLIAKTAQGHE